MNRLAGYTLGPMLGCGASATVWRAVSGPGAPEVAVKQLHGPAGNAALAAAQRHAALVASIGHPGILGVLDVVLDRDTIVVVLPLAPHGSLARLLHRRGWLERGEVVAVAAPVAESLAAAHAAGVGHGDVRPPNVLFGADGRPLLADFAPVLLPPGPPAPSCEAARADVASLHALAIAAVGPATVRPSLAADLAGRRAGTASAFADALRNVGPAAEVRLPPTAPTDDRSGPGRLADPGPPTPPRRAGRMAG